MKFKQLALVAASLGVMASTVAFAVTPEARGLEIAQEVDKRGQGFVDQEADARMVLRNRQGEESVRVMRIRALEGDNQDSGEGDRGLIIFDEPKDVSGTALLTHSFPAKQDDQWLYLPSLKRVKRIASRNKSGPFMGSEFSYEDLSNQDVNKYTYKYLRDEPCGEMQCFVMERFPKDKYSGYQRQVVYVDQAEYRPIKAQYYDRRNELLKTLTTQGWEQHKGKFWRANELSMINHQTGKSTSFTWSNFKFDTGYNESDFDKGALKRIR